MNISDLYLLILYIKYLVGKYYTEIPKWGTKGFKNITPSKLAMTIARFCYRFDVDVSELFYFNFGETNDGRLVIIDASRHNLVYNRRFASIVKIANLENLHNKLTPLIGRRAQSMEGSKEMLEAVEKHMENEPFRIGKGAEGVAIQISPDKVLKVSINDTVGYFATQLAKSNVAGKEFNVLLHELGRLGKYYHWWILERVEEIDSDDLNFCLMDIRRLLDDFDDERKDLILEFRGETHDKGLNIYRPPSWPPEVKAFVNKIAKSVFTRIKKDWDIKGNLNKDWLQNLIKQSSIIYILRGGQFDLRAPNVGLREDGNFVIFDH